MQFLRCTGHTSSAEQRKWLALMAFHSTDTEHFYYYGKFYWIELMLTTTTLSAPLQSRLQTNCIRDLSKYKTDHLICVVQVFPWVSTAFRRNSKYPQLSTLVPCLICTLLTPPSSSTTLLHKCLSLVSCGIAGLQIYSALAFKHTVLSPLNIKFFIA